MPERIEDLPLVLTVEEVAAALRVSRTTAYEGVRTGEIPSVRIGRSIRIPRHMLASYLGVPSEDEPGNGHARPHQDGAPLSEMDERGNGGHVQAGEGEHA
jgi:excisionase family DNA binding protein